MFGANRALGAARVVGSTAMLMAVFLSLATLSAEACSGSENTPAPAAEAGSWDFFTNYGNYMPRIHCVRTAEGTPDWPWIIALIALTATVMAGYLCIGVFWYRCYIREQACDRNKKLKQLAAIFILCAVAGYAFSIVIFVWPVYRLLAIFMVLVNIAIWKFVSNLKPFALSFQAPRLQRELNETLAAEKKELAEKNQELVASKASLQQTVQDLEATNRELDDFAYAASHDLKSPLRAIGTLTEFVAEEVQGVASKDALAYLDQLQCRTQRLNRMITGMLEFARVIRSQRCDQEGTAQQVVEEIVNVLHVPKGFEIVATGQTDAVFCTAITPLTQVLRNLVDNALKFHHSDTGRIEVQARVQKNNFEQPWPEEGPTLHFAVVDDGPGIAAEHQERVFSLFQRLQSRDVIDSTGLGLGVAKRIVESQGGRIWVESKLGHGSTFCFTWPLLRNGEQPEQSHSSESQFASTEIEVAAV